MRHFTWICIALFTLAACGGGGGGTQMVNMPPPVMGEPEPEPEPPLDPPFGGCAGDACTAEEIADIHRHNQQAIRLRQKEDAKRLELSLQKAIHAQQASVVAYDLLSEHEAIYGTGGPSADPQPNPGRGTLRLGTNDPYPVTDYISVGTLPRRLSEWQAFNGFAAFREGKQFTRTVTTTRDDVTIQYGTDEGYPWTHTVKKYLDALDVRAEEMNRHAVVRMREGSTAEEVDLAVRAMQAINSALPSEYRMRMASNEKPDGEDPAAHEITVTFAPINEWPGWETTGPSAVVGWARSVGGTLGAEVWIHGPVVMSPDSPDHSRLTTMIHEFMHALGFWDHVEDGIGVSPDDGVHYGEGSSLLEAGAPPPYGNGAALYPVDKAALLAAFTNPYDLAGWTNESLQIHGRLPLGDVPLDFGATYRNGQATAWGLGEAPKRYLADNPQLTGTVTWDGTLLGFTPTAQSVTGEASIGVNLANLNGRADFTNLETWAGGLGEQGTGTMWRDGYLGYTIAVTGNTFTQTGGDEGYVTGIFVGSAHEGATGTVERADLTGAFGATR